MSRHIVCFTFNSVADNASQIMRLKYGVSGTASLQRFIWDVSSGTLHLGRLTWDAFRP